MRLAGDALRAALDAIVQRWPQEEKILWWQDIAVVATDGHLLVSVPRDCLTGDVPQIPAKRRDLIAKWRAVTQPNPTQIPSAQLLAFAEVSDADTGPCETCKATGCVPCETCEGSGEVECECRECGHMHESECADCEKGQTDCPDCNDREPRYGSLLSLVLNTVLLADLLRIVADHRDIAASVEQLAKGDHNRAYIFRPVGDGPQWLGIIMPMASIVQATVSFQDYA